MSRPEDDAAIATGGCLCGAVRYEARGALRPVIYCHCGQCRRFHGHVAAYSAVPRDALSFTEERGLSWYRASERARRGFCRDCGASLFWAPDERDYVAVAAGSLDPPSGLQAVRHIFVADKGDYYDIDDDLEQLPQGSG